MSAGVDGRDLQLRQVLTVAVAAAVMLAAALLEDDEAGATGMAHHFGLHDRAGQQGAADLHTGIGSHHQHFLEVDRGAGFGFQALDSDDVIGGNAVLLAAGLDDCEHFFFLRVSAPIGAAFPLAGYADFALFLLAFVYHIEFAEALFFLGFPLSLVGLLSINTAMLISVEGMEADVLFRRLRRHRTYVQFIGMFSIFVTATYGMYQNLGGAYGF